jgi:hypothetical protein
MNPYFHSKEPLTIIKSAGYLVLAGRVRREEEAKVIEETLQKHLKCQVDPERLFGCKPVLLYPNFYSEVLFFQ